MKVFIRGRYVDSKEATIHISDRGLNYGDGLFETIRCYKGLPFLMDEHKERLMRGAGVLGIPPGALEGLEKKVANLIKHNSMTRRDGYIKVLLTRGQPTSPAAGLAAAAGAAPTLVITVMKIYGKAVEGYRTKGVAAVTVEGAGTFRGLKTLNYLPNVLARMEATRRGAFEAIFTDGKRVLEGATSNVFVVRKGALYTPPTDGILAGITRAFVMGTARGAGIVVKEKKLYKKDLKGADEAFLTNSIVEIAPLTRVDGVKVGSGRPGEMTKRLQRLFKLERESL